MEPYQKKLVEAGEEVDLIDKHFRRAIACMTAAVRDVDDIQRERNELEEAIVAQQKRHMFVTFIVALFTCLYGFAFGRYTCS